MDREQPGGGAGGDLSGIPGMEDEKAAEKPQAWYASGGDGAEGEGGLVDKLKTNLARIEIEDEDLAGLPPPPEDPRVGMLVSAGGGLLMLVGLTMLLYSLPSLVGAFYCMAMGLTGYGAVVVLYGQWHGSLARKPMPAHRSSSPEATRSVWETLMTVSVVVALGNLPLLLLLCWATATFLHWTLALLVAVGGNVLLVLAGYRGDGVTRRPIPPAVAGPEGGAPGA